MSQLKIFIELTRLNKPIGFMLLFWPCIWGLTIVFNFDSNLFTYFYFAILFLTGSIIDFNGGIASKLNDPNNFS